MCQNLKTCPCEVENVQFTSSIKQNYEFRRLYNTGKSAATGLIAVYCRRNRRGTNQFGITVGSKVGNAVVRNRVRRRLREAYRLRESSFAKGFDIVVVARARAADAPFDKLQDEMLRLAKKLGCAL